MPILNELGTSDKLHINGHYYSDKSPVPNVLLAGVYWCELQLGMPSATQRPDLFAYTLTVLTSGLSYMIAVLAMLALSGSLFAKPWQRHFFTASFAFSTFALIYTQYVNSHVMQLAVVACLVGRAIARPGLWQPSTQTNVPTGSVGQIARPTDWIIIGCLLAFGLHP